LSLGWRGWSRVLHRDLGYAALGLTLAYALSGLAVNHKGQWNPNRRAVLESRELGAFDPQRPEEELVLDARRRLAHPAAFRSAFQQDASTLQLFLDGWTCSIDLPTGKAVLEGHRPRPVLYTLNQMHLNARKGVWVWVADGFAVALVLLALSGLFILKGRQGLEGRGKWFVAAGVLLPALVWGLV